MNNYWPNFCFYSNIRDVKQYQTSAVILDTINMSITCQLKEAKKQNANSVVKNLYNTELKSSKIEFFWILVHNLFCKIHWHFRLIKFCHLFCETKGVYIFNHYWENFFLIFVAIFTCLQFLCFNFFWLPYNAWVNMAAYISTFFWV
jgi:hypothetical protein